MANETIIEKAETKAADAVDAVKESAKTVATKTDDAAKTVGALAAAAKPVRKARAAVAKRRARKAPAKVAKAVKKTTKRAQASATRAAKSATKVAATQIERNTNMAYDFTKMFSAVELPGTEQFQSLFSGANERSQEMVRRSQKAAEEMADIAKANVEALTEAGRIAATGAKSLGQDMLASGREGFEQASTAVKTLADAKSPTEFVQLQAELARTSFDRVVAEGSKFAEAMVKLAGEAVQPISNRASVNAERINELAA
ncbi:MAG: phasin family protein [Sphingomicrobium sp.]